MSFDYPIRDRRPLALIGTRGRVSTCDKIWLCGLKADEIWVMDSISGRLIVVLCVCAAKFQLTLAKLVTI